MVPRVMLPFPRLLPHGPVDLARQVLLLVGAFLAYRLTRGAVGEPGAVAQAFQNARELITIERGLNVFVEPSVQAFVAGERWLLHAASWLYINTQTSVTVGALLWLYLFRNRSFYFVRNMFLVAFAIALVGYAVFPTAPPRFLPEWGFSDAVSEFTGVPQDSGAVGALVNPYAAVPSMHVGFAVMIGGALARLVRHRVAKGLWLAYPPLVTVVIVVTANHFLADALLGALTAAAGAAVSWWLGRARPRSWSFAPAGLPAT